MSVDLELSPKAKRAAGEPCCEPVFYPDVERHQAERIAKIAKALGDPVRLQLVDVLGKHAGKVCVCELVPLFDLSQPTVSHHLKVSRAAGIVAPLTSRRDGRQPSRLRRHSAALRVTSSRSTASLPRPPGHRGLRYRPASP